MQSHCHCAEKTLVAHIPILQCASSSLRVVINNVQMVTFSSTYAHPKLGCSSLLSHKCDFVKCYFCHATDTVKPNLNQDLLRTTVPRRPASQPTPLMHIRLPPPPLSPSHPLATGTLDFHPHKSSPPLVDHIMLQHQVKLLISHRHF